jgi:hypothetical protein
VSTSAEVLQINIKKRALMGATCKVSGARKTLPAPARTPSTSTRAYLHLCVRVRPASGAPQLHPSRNCRLPAAVDYDEQGSEEFIDFYRMVDGDGPFKDVRRLRDAKLADVVGLILDNPSGYGLSTRVWADSEDAYFVVHYACAAITISMAHEIGHILGAQHDRLTDLNNTPYPYGHGFVNGSKWRTS